MLCPVQEEQVRDYWSYCGEIEKLDVMRFPDTGRFKGIAFITFAEVLSLKGVGSAYRPSPTANCNFNTLIHC